MAAEVGMTRQWRNPALLGVMERVTVNPVVETDSTLIDGLPVVCS